MHVTPYKLFTTRELGEIQAHMEKLVNQWAQSWFAAEARVIGITVNPCEQFRGEDLANPDALWTAVSTTDDHWVAALHQGASVDAIRRLVSEHLVGDAEASDSDYSLASELSEKLLFDLAENVLQKTSRNVEKHAQIHRVQRTLAPHTWHHGAGAVCVSMSMNNAKVYLVISPEIAAGYFSSQKTRQKPLKPLMEINKAIHPTKIKLQIMAGAAVLSIAELKDVAVGDTVRLDTKLNEPISAMVGGKKICSAFLGTREGRKAVILMSLH